VSQFRLYRVNRSSRVSPRVGGKGFIVARALRRLDVAVTIHGFLGGAVGHQFRGAAVELGMCDQHTDIADETRVNTIVVDPELGKATVINEPGPWVTGKEFALLRERLLSSVKGGDLIAFSGSLPRGITPADYAQLVAEC